MNNTICRIIWDWGLRCFGHKHMLDKKTRALRLAEEAIEQRSRYLPSCMQSMRARMVIRFKNWEA